jgi:hypothetical protein
LRDKYRPKQIRVLFIGESPPANGTFFYAGNSNLFKHTREAFVAVFGDGVGQGARFLSFFKSHGCYLDDLCELPVNNLPVPQRRDTQRAGVSSLASRIADGRPEVVIVVMRGIEKYVRRAMAAAGISNVPCHSLTFPSMGHQQGYVRGLKLVLQAIGRKVMLDEKIAVLGWGSLIWEPGSLQIESDWLPDGPLLPVEYARKSERRHNALTLVLHPGMPRVQVLWAVSSFHELARAIEDLKVREETSTTRIGFVSLRDGSSRSQVIPEVADIVRQWTQEKGLEATIWTDLASNFAGAFTDEDALAHLRSLAESGREAAKRYVLNTPHQIQTRLRPLLTRELDIPGDDRNLV